MRQLLSAVVLQPIGNQQFVENTTATAQPVQADMYNYFFDTATNQADLTFKTVSDNPTLVGASVSGSLLTLGIAPSASGYAHVQVVATDPNGATASQTFRVQLTASTARSLDVELSSTRRSVTFTQGNHVPVTVTLFGPGKATVHLGGDKLKLSGGHVAGSNAELESISVTGSTVKTSLEVAGHSIRRGAVVGDINVDGPSHTLFLSNAVLDGDISAPGGVHTIVMGTALSGQITLGGSGPMIFDASFVQDENFSSTVPIQHMRLGQWTNSDNVAETFSAPYIKALTTAGNFTPGLQLSGTGAPKRTLDHATIGGSVGGTWNVAGTSGPLHIGGAGTDFNATFGAIPSIIDTGLFDGSITAPTLDKFTVAGGMVAASITLTASNTRNLRTLTVGAGMFADTIKANGSIGDIRSTVLQGCTITAGVGTLPTGTVLPTSASGFASASSIHSIVMRPKGKQVGFSGSDIAAGGIGTLSFGTMQTSNSGKTFGLAASSIGSFSARDLSHHQTLNFKDLHDPAALAAQIAARKLNMGDFVITLL